MRRLFTPVLLLLVLCSTAWAGDESRSIGRSHRTIMSAATALERSPRKVKNQGLIDLRVAIVRNTAARLALKKEQGKTAMHLTLEARRLARDILDKLGEANNTGFLPDPEETAAAQGGAGKNADGAIAEAEKIVPDVEKLEESFPYDIDNFGE